MGRQEETNNMFRESSPLSAVSAGYVEDLYDRFRTSPDGVDESWRSLFGALDLAVEPTVTGAAGAGADGRRAALTEALRRWGHLSARLNPLAAPQPLPDVEEFAAHLSPQAGPLDILRALYCGSLAVETAHIDDPALQIGRASCRERV